MTLIDTCVFIDFFRGKKQAYECLKKLEKISTSMIVMMELIQGMPDKRSLIKLKKLIQSLGLIVHPITEETSIKAYELFEKHYHSTGIGVADALIAATAIVNEDELLTLNTKHFKSISEIAVLKPY